MATLRDMTTTQLKSTLNTSEKLRQIRKSKGWSLQDVEKHSKGKWKAVVIGSYERSDRAISLKKAIELMEFYKVPITELFEGEKTKSFGQQPSHPIILDQRLLAKHSDLKLEGLKRLVTLLTSKRRDWNGEVLSVRSTDMQFIAILLNLNVDEATTYLREHSLLL